MDGSGQVTPTLGAVIETGARTVLAEAHTALPGRVVSYDDDLQRATVEIPVRERRRPDELDGEPTYTDMPPVLEAPVVHPRGAGWHFHHELQRGDPVLLVIAERSIEEWIATGDAAIDPADPRRFDLSDAYVLPGGAPRPQATPASARKAGALTLSSTDGATQLVLEDGRAELKAGTVVLGDGTVEVLDQLTRALEQTSKALANVAAVHTGIAALQSGSPLVDTVLAGIYLTSSPQGGPTAAQITAAKAALDAAKAALDTLKE